MIHFILVHILIQYKNDVDVYILIYNLIYKKRTYNPLLYSLTPFSDQSLISSRTTITTSNLSLHTCFTKSNNSISAPPPKKEIHEVRRLRPTASPDGGGRRRSKTSGGAREESRPRASHPPPRGKHHARRRRRVQGGLPAVQLAPAPVQGTQALLRRRPQPPPRLLIKPHA